MRIIFIVCIILLSTQFLAQKKSSYVSMKWEEMVWDIPGDPKIINAFETPDGYVLFKKHAISNAFETPDGYVLFKKHAIRGPGGVNYYIEKLNKNLKRTGFYDISEGIDEKNYYVEEIFEFGGKVYLITSSDIKVSSKEEYYIQEVDWEIGSVGKRNLVYTYEYTGRRSNMSLYVRISPSNTHLLLSFAPSAPMQRWTRRQTEADKRSFIVFDEELEIIDRVENVDMEYSGDQYSVIQTLISDKADVYLLAERIIENRGEEAIMSILKFSNGELIANQISFQEGRLNDLLISTNMDGTLYCTGYYDEGIGRRSGRGVVAMNIDPKTAEPINISTQLIGKDLLIEGMSDRQVSRVSRNEIAGKEPKQLSEIYAREIINHNDGTSSLIGEVYYVLSHTVSDANGGMRTYLTYHYDEMFISRINQNGEIISTIKLPKKRSVSVPLIRSYFAFNIKDELGIMFYDHRQNLIEIGSKGILPYPAKAKISVLAFAKIDMDGNYEREYVIDYMEKPYIGYRHYLFGRDAIMVSNSRILFMTYYGRKKFGYGLAEIK